MNDVIIGDSGNEVQSAMDKSAYADQHRVELVSGHIDGVDSSLIWRRGVLVLRVEFLVAMVLLLDRCFVVRRVRCLSHLARRLPESVRRRY